MKKVLIGLAVVIIAVLGFIATRPSNFRVERSIEIATTPEVPYSLISDFHQWTQWSPWEKIDPNLKRTYEGAASGVGASYSWAGNDQVGEGKQTITAVKPAESIDIKLEFMKPWTATHAVRFAFTPAGEKTKVTWSMDGTNDFVGKAFSIFMDFDSMVGKDFENGLNNLKGTSEAEYAKRKEEAAAAAAAAAPAEDAAPATP